jgi:hypothetical protein
LLTQQAAAGADENDTIQIMSGGVKLRVLQKCVAEMPPLEPKQGASDHVAACWVAK